MGLGSRICKGFMRKRVHVKCKGEGVELCRMEDLDPNTDTMPLTETLSRSECSLSYDFASFEGP